MKKHRNKYTLLLVCLLLTVAIAVSGTIAYLFTSSDPVVNTFTPVLPEIEIPEEFDKTIKENATIQNTGDVDSFLRARIVVTWQNDKGEVYPETPDPNSDYTMRNGANWQEVDGCYYYKKVAAPGEPAVTKDDTTGQIEYGTNVTENDMLIISARVISAAPAKVTHYILKFLGNPFKPILLQQYKRHGA